MTIRPPYADEIHTPWPTRNQIKRAGHGIAMPGRSFTNISHSDLQYLVGDIMADISGPYDCAKLQITEVTSTGPERLFTVCIAKLLTSDIPFHGFAKMYFNKYIESFCKNMKSPGVPIDIFIERTGSFYEEDARSNPGC